MKFSWSNLKTLLTFAAIVSGTVLVVLGKLETSNMAGFVAALVGALALETKADSQ